MGLSIATLQDLLPALLGPGPGDAPFCFSGFVLDDDNIAFVYGPTAECQDAVAPLAASARCQGGGYATLAEAEAAAMAAARMVRQCHATDGDGTPRVMSVVYRAGTPQAAGSGAGGRDRY